ncbi:MULTISPECIES: hypothetical protein [unclassified Sphingomonas]|uniref:hypothetical protein n=1 Tax=unclassified Sphingomonas TaxID=196159 RepID=UPI0006F3C17D|nr:MULTISPECIES: hypothetical protein [unclassified Sphingomonas]KRB87699.1 hypothetical protein ASE22_23630 [Sphingomonas sp. Root720]
MENEKIPELAALRSGLRPLTDRDIVQRLTIGQLAELLHKALAYVKLDAATALGKREHLQTAIYCAEADDNAGAVQSLNDIITPGTNWVTSQPTDASAHLSAMKARIEALDV